MSSPTQLPVEKRRASETDIDEFDIIPEKERKLSEYSEGKLNLNY